MAVSSVRSYGSLASGEEPGDKGSQEGLMVGGTVTVRHKEDRQEEGQGIECPEMLIMGVYIDTVEAEVRRVGGRTRYSAVMGSGTNFGRLLQILCKW